METYFIDNGIDYTRLGELALVNALCRATGKRLYHQPYIVELEGRGINLG
ncbi:hypothetical protein [Kriegella aquimaris]|nr:hypothetical protein [Kriegella aquimaris]